MEKSEGAEVKYYSLEANIAPGDIADTMTAGHGPESQKSLPMSYWGQDENTSLL